MFFLVENVSNIVNVVLSYIMPCNIGFKPRRAVTVQDQKKKKLSCELRALPFLFQKVLKLVSQYQQHYLVR